MLLRAAVFALSGFGLTPANVSAQEFRALWADAFNIGLKRNSEVSALVDTARAGNFNAIVAQVRKRGDAYYRGGLEPVASDVVSGYDPLADLIAKAHDTSDGKQRIEVHAWLVTYNIWNSETGIPSQTTHPYRLHPEWLTEQYRANPSDPATPAVRWDGSNYQFDQGHPEVQQHTFDVSMDVLTRYAVDGLHYDYIRYSDSGSSSNFQPWGYHPVSVARFQKQKSRTGIPTPGDALWLQWRRDQVTALLRKVYLNAWALRPETRISAALITYGNTAPGFGTNDFQTQSEAYRRVLQDWRGWIEEGILDLACPMAYKTSTAGVTSWIDYTRRRQYQRASAVGLGSYLNSTTDNINQMRLAREAAPSGEKAAGLLGYSYYATENTAITAADRLARRNEFMTALTTGAGALFTQKVEPPAMPWKSNQTKGHLMGFVSDAMNLAVFDGSTLSLTGPVTRTLLTDATGFYGTVDLPVGNYTLTISVPGYASQVRALTISGAEVRQEHLLMGPPMLVIRDFSFSPATRRATLTWSSEIGQTFRVEYSDDLTVWRPHAEGWPSGGLSTGYLTPAAPPDALRRSWRIRRE